MNLFILIILFLTNVFSSVKNPNADINFENKDIIHLSKTDQIIAENLINTIKLIEKNYLSKELLAKIILETEKSSHFINFIPWLKDIQQISQISTLPNLINHCRQYVTRRENLAIERYLERLAGNFCRERTLEAISRDVEKSKNLSNESLLFIQQNLKFYLTKKNRKNFSFFLKSHEANKGLLKLLSQEVTSYSIRNEIIPSHELLRDIEINEQFTSLIQNKGFNPLHHQNVFYAEFSKLLEQGYRILESKAPEEKVYEHVFFLKNFLDLNQDHLPLGLCLSRLNDFSKIVFRSGYETISRDTFKFVISKNNKGIREDALFFYLWTYLFKNEFKEAQKLAIHYDLMKNNKLIQDARLKFWIGFIHEKLGQEKEAILLYEDVVFNNPLNYYAIMASKKLQVIKPNSRAVNFYIRSIIPPSYQPSINLKDLDQDYFSSLTRLKAWATLQSNKFIKLEIKRLKNHSMPGFLVNNATENQLFIRSDLHLIHSKIIQESHNYLEAFRYLYTVLDNKEVIFNRRLLEILYPSPYLDLLSKTVKKDIVDPIVVLALIRQESVFNPEARSRVGARGLMQLMPGTAKRFRKYVVDQQLINPLINVEIGTQYFNTLMKRYDGNLVYVLSAYNAGEARVERWKNQYFDTDETILKNIEAIPFLETRNYVKLIFRNIFFYKLLLDRQNQLADSKEINKIFDVHLGFNN
jgi:soluble lytic murein transglycosylase